MIPLEIGAAGNKPECIIVHSSGSSQEGVDRIEIHRWHLARGFAGFGYHWLVMPDGECVPGRVEYRIGAHARGRNEDTIGICVVGGMTSKGMVPFTDAQDAMVCELIASRCLAFDIKPERVLGHNELPGVNKTCPDRDMDALRRRVAVMLERRMCI